jgi:hypothetical protein
MERLVPAICFSFDTMAVVPSVHSNTHAEMGCGGAASEMDIPTYTRRQLSSRDSRFR